MGSKSGRGRRKTGAALCHCPPPLPKSQEEAPPELRTQPSAQRSLPPWGCPAASGLCLRPARTGDLCPLLPGHRVPSLPLTPTALFPSSGHIWPRVRSNKEVSCFCLVSCFTAKSLKEPLQWMLGCPQTPFPRTQAGSRGPRGRLYFMILCAARS